MPSYDDWSRAIARFYGDTAPRNTRGYLSLDDDVLPVIVRYLEQNVADPRADFLAAVQGRCVLHGQVVTRDVRGRHPDGHPRSGAFLAALVLAASRMGEDERTSSGAYFSRLREILHLPRAGSGVSRPSGLRGRDEESLWKEWNAWSQEIGVLPTARAGRGRRDKYRGFAIGQSLLRDADKQSLRSLFARFRFGTLLDGEEVLRRTRKNAGGLSLHLREILGDERAEAAADRVFEVYEEWNEARIDRQRAAGEKSQTALGQGWHPFERGSKTLFCGLLRREHPFTGHASFHLLPRFRPHHGAAKGQLKIGDNWRSLSPLDARWWKSAGPLDEPMLASGHTFQVSGAGNEPHVYSQATLPARDFWVLVPDDAYGSDDFGSWRGPRLGEEFVLVAKNHLFPHLLPLRGRVLDYDSPEPLENAPGWSQVWGMRVVASDWSGLTLPDILLLEALRPKVHLTVSLSGGVRVPFRAGLWLEGFGPHLTVHAVPTDEAEDARVELVAPSTKVHEFSLAPNSPFPLPLDEKGVWLAQVSWAGQTASTLFEISSWDTLPMAEPEPLGATFSPWYEAIADDAVSLGGAQ